MSVVTLSVIKADMGGFVGHGDAPEMLAGGARRWRARWPAAC